MGHAQMGSPIGRAALLMALLAIPLCKPKPKLAYQVQIVFILWNLPQYRQQPAQV